MPIRVWASTVPSVKTYCPAVASRLSRSGFVRNAGVLLAHTIVGHTLAIAAGPILTRLYSPEDFGVFGLMVSFVAATGVLTALNYDAAVPAPNDDGEAAGIVAGATAIILLMSTALCALYAGMIWFDVLGYGVLPVSSSLVLWLYLATAGGISILNYWSIRRNHFDSIGEGTIAQNVGRSAVQVTLGAVGLSWIGLALGEIVGRLANLGRLAVVSLHDLKSVTPHNALSVLRTLRNYRRFPCILMPAMLVDQVVASISIPLMTTLFGLEMAGQYFLMRRVLDMPSALISKTLADVFYARVAIEARERPDTVRRFVVKVFLAILLPSAVAALPVVLFGPELFSWTFGEKWRSAGLFAALATPALVMNLGVAPVTRVFAVTKRPALRYVHTAINAVGVSLVFAAAHAGMLNITYTVAALGAVSLASYIAYFGAACVAAKALDAPHNI